MKDLESREWDTFISFATEEAFQGAVVLAGALLSSHALERVTQLGINPGGEAIIYHVKPGHYPYEVLLSRERLLEIDGRSRLIEDLPPEEWPRAFNDVRGFVEENDNPVKVH